MTIPEYLFMTFRIEKDPILQNMIDPISSVFSYLVIDQPWMIDEPWIDTIESRHDDWMQLFRVGGWRFVRKIFDVITNPNQDFLCTNFVLNIKHMNVCYIMVNTDWCCVMIIQHNGRDLESSSWHVMSIHLPFFDL